MAGMWRRLLLQLLTACPAVPRLASLVCVPPSLQVGVSNLAVRGTVRLSLKPLLDDFPFAGSAKARAGGGAGRRRAGNAGGRGRTAGMAHHSSSPAGVLEPPGPRMMRGSEGLL